MIDFTSDFGKRAARHLGEEEVIWLTTTDSQGGPQPRPVWFYWNGENLLIFSQPQAHKIRHIKDNPRVALNFNCTDRGEDVVVLLGEAEIDPAPVPDEEMAAYLQKYQNGLVGISMTEKEFQESYSTVIRIRPTHLRGF